MGTSTNATVSKLQSDMAQFKADFGKYLTDEAAFRDAVKAFIASVGSGTGGTTLSPSDQQALADMSTAVEAADQSAVTADQALSQISVPSGTVPSGSTSQPTPPTQPAPVTADVPKPSPTPAKNSLL